jgi:hypothetical protein
VDHGIQRTAHWDWQSQRRPSPGATGSVLVMCWSAEQEIAAVGLGCWVRSFRAGCRAFCLVEWSGRGGFLDILVGSREEGSREEGSRQEGTRGEGTRGEGTRAEGGGGGGGG